MGLFGSGGTDHTATQLEVYEEMIAERGEELAKLDGIDTPNAATRRKELTEEIRQTKINMAQLKDSAERAGQDIGAYDRERDILG
ncbi:MULTISPECIES: hypothetical protein [unclassified Phaeobacter]|mgnify:FL=1|uniref:hypothetical protein n=1 Tax=unclassified Phaeobacter TaxID=2621772 RepID=UPI003A8C7572